MTSTLTPVSTADVVDLIEEEHVQRDAYLEVVLSFVLAVALIILIFIQLVVRSKLRHARLAFMRQRVRFDALHFLARPSDPRRLIAERSRARYTASRSVVVPQYDRVVPVINRDRRHDPRKEAQEMLHQIRAHLPPTRASGPPARMTMQACLACIRDVLDRRLLSRFIQIHEAVLFGVHIGDGTGGDVTVEDLQFLRAYFVTIMKEIM